MKKSAKFLSIILSLAASVSVFSLAACGTEPEKTNPPPASHTHTFATEWSSDDADHWHAATCEHKTEVKDKAAHDDKGADGACSVCGRAHVHTFDEGWESDGTYHWHVATCDHYDLTDGKARHTLENGECTVCGWTAHAHTYDATAWTSNDVYHWRAATCEHTLSVVDEQAKHTFDADMKCTVCEYVHEHTFDTKYWTTTADKHWHAPKCYHRDIKLDEGDHEFDENGQCTVCKFMPNGDNHTHTYAYDWDSTSHWQKMTCSLGDNFKSCGKGYNKEAPRYKNLENHTYGANGACTVCGFTNEWLYEDDCIKCDVCDGCIKTVCVHDGEAGHKKCGDRGEDAKTYTIEAEDAVVSARGDDTKNGSIVDYTNGVRKCIHTSYSNVKFTVEASKECYVTLRLRIGRKNSGLLFNDCNIEVNGEVIETKAILAQPKVSDTKCSLDWLTVGCIKLSEGINEIALYQVGGEENFHLDKIELSVDADVDITYEATDNSRLIEMKEWEPMYKDPQT